MTKNQLTREENVQAVFDLKAGYTLGLADVDILKRVARMALAAMDSEPVVWINGCNKSVPAALRYLAENPRPIGGESSFNTAHLYQMAREIELMAEATLYRHAQQPVVPEEMPSNLRGLIETHTDRLFDDDDVQEIWNACRAAMLQELQKSAGVSNNCRSCENVQDLQAGNSPAQGGSRCSIKAAPALDSSPKTAESRCGNSLANDTNVVKRLTITLPDTSSKAFWSGTGKTETFHPVTYRRWVKEAIERYCAIARIDVEVK